MPNTLIIIPTYNEADNIKSIIQCILSQDLLCDVLVVDDSSPDKTSELVKNLSRQFKNIHLIIRTKKEGIGKAYQEGFAWALKHQYQFIFQMDADFSHNPNDLTQMKQLIENKYQIVVGSRYAKGISVVNWPLGRIILSLLGSIYVRLILDMPIRDSTSGFVGYTREVLSKLDLTELKFTGYAYQIEMKYRAYIQGFKMIEHPIIFLNREFGKSKMDYKIIREAIFGVPYLRINKSRFK
ncbi:MAG: polyprenol monophosphomannose synthase [Flavobacteriaceae bacterium]|nr:polyprenol monophosphomannose synthase [Flavobacteriaceae bacterium]MCY4267051.1 polyprenol monophosphomannose synthase [Flavobacteriaceae bacterium]MCY4299314.1 polyprenol monophosphomannose synthase [Flavobacteriaceae bacterium]